MPTKTKPVVSFRIPRRKWSRGMGMKNPNMAMYNGNGAQDALGFAINQIARIHNRGITGVASPEDASRSSRHRIYSSPLHFLLESGTRGNSSTNSETCQKIMNVNDRVKMSDQKREREIAKLFAKQGIEVEFID